MGIRFTDPRKKKNEFAVWTDSDDDGTRVAFKSQGEMSQALDSMSAVSKMSPEQLIINNHPQLAGIINNPTLSGFKKKLAVLPILKQMNEERAQLNKALAKADDMQAFAEEVVSAYNEFKQWRLTIPKLEKNDCSRLHILIAYLNRQYKYMPEAMKNGDPAKYPWESVVPFVVQHDWASAFKNATDYDGNFNLPYEYCAFEFRISGRSVTILAHQAEDCEPSFTPYAQIGEYWVTEDKYNQPSFEEPYAKFALDQVKAICVALDAEVATRTMIRAPEALNRKRASEGKLPLYSYHIVNLNRKYRAINPSSGGGAHQGKKRLHFRRGHWRHYTSFKTWVRWTLVGNPELGFIDQEYRL